LDEARRIVVVAVGDGSEINRLTATYPVTDGTAGRRISVLAVHNP